MLDQRIRLMMDHHVCDSEISFSYNYLCLILQNREKCLIRTLALPPPTADSAPLLPLVKCRQTEATVRCTQLCRTITFLRSPRIAAMAAAFRCILTPSQHLSMTRA